MTKLIRLQYVLHFLWNIEKFYGIFVRKALRDMWKRKFNFVTINAKKIYDFEHDHLDKEYCENLLVKPSSEVYAALNKWLQNSPKEWLEQFLDCGALQLMFNTLNFMGLKKTSFSEAVIELEIMRAIKLILNSRTGIEYLINLHEDHYLIGSLVLGKS